MQTFCKTWLGISLKLTWTNIMSDLEDKCWSPHSSHFLQIVQDQRAWLWLCLKKSNWFSSPSPSSVVTGLPEVRAWSLETMNSCPSELMSLTYLRSEEWVTYRKQEAKFSWTSYIASGPSQPPKDFASPPTSIAESLAVIVCLSVIDAIT